jgi:hypothetical protein
LVVEFVERDTGPGNVVEYVRGDVFDRVVAALEDATASVEIRGEALRAIEDVRNERRKLAATDEGADGLGGVVL